MLMVMVFLLLLPQGAAVRAYRLTATESGERSLGQTSRQELETPPEQAVSPEECIRFHVLANSDTEEDQRLKRAVRDAILERVSPTLAGSQSLAESRELLKKALPLMEQTARQVVENQGWEYPVRVEYGIFSFPTKSYGTLVLPAGKYEAVRICIGEAAGSNWWCVLFPPLCFVDIEQAAAVPVDGKPGIGIGKDSPETELAPESDLESESKELNAADSAGKPKPRIWLWEQIKKRKAVQ
jgi:stage II sporulation protein R